MSENLELVRSIYAAWERGDWSSVAWAHPEIEFIVVDGPEPFRSIGVDTMRSRWRTWLAAWQDFRVELVELRELDTERVLALTRYGGRGRASGLELEGMSEAASVFRIRDGAVKEFVNYNDRQYGLAELGLEE